MAYTPINWQTGDTITAEKLNRCDNGWGVGITQLFSETVTTADSGQGFSSGAISYSPVIDADSIAVTFDGTDYTCPRIDFGGDYFYGGFSATTPGPDFSNYPFFIGSGAEGNTLYTQTAGTHTVAASGDAVVCGSDFTKAVQSVIGQTGAVPFELVEGQTMCSDAQAAFSSGRLVYFDRSLQRYFVSKVGYGDAGVKFVPESSTFTAGFSYDYETFYFTVL